ncbi:MAG: alpha/beta fold hydrolase [Candidatus Omnitrophica bacterium]|nr:alpha/beta fold hydrolase [Candidatus Omnitrophota bacterium]
MKHTLYQNQTAKASDGTDVFYDRYTAGHDKVIIIAHGFYNSKGSVLLKDLGHELLNQYDCIIMDFRGHGKTKGLFYWTSKEPMDLETVLEQARQMYGKVGVIGFSLGAATSLIVASKYKLMDSLIAVSPPVSFWQIEFHFWDLCFENDILYNIFGEGKVGKGVWPGPFWLPKLKPKNLVESILIPVHYIHGEADWLIRPWHSRELFSKTKVHKKLSMIKRGPHAEYLVRKNRDEFIGLIREWFGQTLQ